jgi:hypothetical protein
MKHLLFAALLFINCSSSDGGDVSVTCEQSDRSGSYWAEFETLSGTCPDQDPGLIQIGPGSAAGGCTELASPRWSDADCTYETHAVCPVEGLPGAEIEFVSITTQQDSNGDRITGTMTMYLRDGGGELCHGSFRMTATRQ